MDINESEKRERIARLIEIEGLSQKAFADKVGINSTNLNQVMLGNRPVPKALPSKIVKAFPEVRIDWLLDGNGEMYSKDQLLADTQALHKNMELLPTKPRLPKFMSEGHLEEYYEGKKRVLCTERPIVAQLPSYNFSLILKNNRMSPKYERGDELFFRKASFPEWGNEFLLDTDDGPKFKRIYPAFAPDDEEGSDPNKLIEYIRCVSYNKEEFPDFLIKRKYVHAFYRCVGALRIL